MEGGNHVNNNEQDVNIDLSLRLGSPIYDRMRMEDNRGNRENNQAGQLGRENVEFAGCGNGRADVVQAAEAVANILPQPQRQNVGIPARRRGLADREFRICMICRTTNTPLWRKGPDDPQTLCNACGLRFSRNVRRTDE